MSIRNFCIIAHIDHGKSTLADRFLEFTHTVEKRNMQEQVLDSMDLEREKGITIKLQPVRMEYVAKDGKPYQLNLIDTPGHVDFQYEVSRSLAACEGAVLLVDASQGIQAQTLANLYLALEQELEIIPVLNKIDLPSARPDDVAREICHVLGCSEEDILRVSGKTGEGVQELLEHIIAKIPSPVVQQEKEPRALIFDSLYDSFQGVVAYVRVVDGVITKGDALRMFATGEKFEVMEIGVFRPQRQPVSQLCSGEVGYIATGQKEIGDARVGDTVVSSNYSGSPLAGYKPAVPMVFASFYPVEAQDYDLLRTSLEKLALNDAALQYIPEQSNSLGRGFRLGFLGMLHMEIIHQRLLREYDLNIVVTIPSVIYRITTTTGAQLEVSNPSEVPESGFIEHILEPFAKMEIVTPSPYVGSIMALAEKYRGEYQTTEYLDQERAVLHYQVPLASIVSDFYDALKGVSSGYASLSYELSGYRQSDIVKMDILVSGEPVEAFSRMVPRSETLIEGRRMVKKLKDLLPKQQFEVPVQAALGSKIVARETIRAFRKDVIAGLYGGDVTRKRKLLEKQKKGKKRMKHIGQVAIPQEVFIEMMKK